MQNRHKDRTFSPRLTEASNQRLLAMYMEKGLGRKILKEEPKCYGHFYKAILPPNFVLEGNMEMNT